MKVLYVGSSYLAGRVPVLVDGLAKAAGRDVYTRTVIRSGVYLSGLIAQSTTTAAIHEQPWDFVVLQDAGPNASTPEGDRGLREALTEFRDLVGANCPTTQVVFMMPWAFEDGMLWAGGTDDYFAMQRKIRDVTVAWAKRGDFMLAPVGWAFNAIMIESPPVHYLFQADFNHPSEYGEYLSACTIAVAMLQMDLTDASYSGGLPETAARHFRDVAGKVTLSDLAAWNIPSRPPESGGH